MYVYYLTMKQTFQTEIEQEVSLDRSIGTLFADKLEEKNLLAEFDRESNRTLVIIDGSVVDKNGNVGGTALTARVADILKLIVKPTQEVSFQPILAGG